MIMFLSASGEFLFVVVSACSAEKSKNKFKIVALHNCHQEVGRASRIGTKEVIVKGKMSKQEIIGMVIYSK